MLYKFLHRVTSIQCIFSRMINRGSVITFEMNKTKFTSIQLIFFLFIDFNFEMFIYIQLCRCDKYQVRGWTVNY